MHPSIKNSINKTRVLQEIRKEKGISRIEIASLLNLDKSTISKITSDLLNQGLIIDKKTDEELNHAGRRRIGLHLNDEYGVIIGLEIQTQYFYAVVINLQGDILSNYKAEIPDGEFLESLYQMLDIVIKKTENEFRNLLGIGIGIPGLINSKDGIINRSNPLNINEPLGIYDFLVDKFNYPIFIENDANCCCWGELTFCKGKRDNNFLVALGEQRQVTRNHKNQNNLVVGLGIVINGKVLTGDNYSTGEFKSIFWNDSELTQFSVNKEDIVVLDDREKTLKVIDELLKHIALFVNSLNFTKVIFSGVFTDYKIDIKRILNEHVTRNWGYNDNVKIGINFTTFGDYDVSYGAAGMIVEKLFTTPDITNTLSKYNLNGIDLFNYISNSENFSSPE